MSWLLTCSFISGILVNDIEIKAAVLAFVADNEAASLLSGYTTASGRLFCRQCTGTSELLIANKRRFTEYVHACFTDCL